MHFRKSTALILILLSFLILLSAWLACHSYSSRSAVAITLDYPDSEGSARHMLEQLGCGQELMAVITRFFFHPVAFLILVSILTVAALVVDLRLARQNMQLNLGARVLAVSVLLAVFQWHASLEQDAMQRYEVEISNANNAEEHAEVPAMLPHLYPSSNPSDYPKIRFVYIHLDNLEYSLGRYREGFASALTTSRAIMTFVEHCKEQEFRRRAQQQVNGYSPLVRHVVAAILSRM
jgi:hypothetical protein